MASLRSKLQTPAGKAVGTVAAVLGLLLAAWVVWTRLSATPAGVANERPFLDLSTGKTFEYQLRAGDQIPVKAPSGEMTGYPAEACYWTKDGKEKSEPTWVVLNGLQNKPGATFCPDCDRLVVDYNPVPGPGVKPPPTRAEFERRRSR